jgi:OFA family oxalate/formate antiporter-like MFS transporter
MSDATATLPAHHADTASRSHNRWIPVFASIAIQLCLGTAYIWGVFQPEVMKQFGWSAATTALTFSFLLGTLTFGSTFGGLIQDRFSPRPVVIGGGIILGIGFILACFTTAGTPWWLWMSYGIIGGFGMGTTYSTTIACCQKWFPDRRGFITGVIVSALGFGGLVFTPIAQMLIKQTGVLPTFMWLGVIFIVVCTLGGLFITNPPAGFAPAGWTPPAPKPGARHGQDFTPLDVLKTPQFYLVIATFMLATAAGLMVIPFAKVLGLNGGLSPAAATFGVMVIAMCNSFGRLFWGWMSDKVGRKNTLLMLTLLAGISILFVAAAQSYLILALIGVVAFSYGGFLGTFPAITADYWGMKNMGVNYGMVLLGFGIGAVASAFVAGYYKDVKGDFTTPFIIASIAAFTATVLVLFLKPPAKRAAVAE